MSEAGGQRRRAAARCSFEKQPEGLQGTFRARGRNSGAAALHDLDAAMSEGYADLVDTAADRAGDGRRARQHHLGQVWERSGRRGC